MSIRLVRRLLALAGLPAAMVLASLMVLPSATAGASTPWIYYQYNMWGSVHHPSDISNSWRLDSFYDSWKSVGVTPSAITMEELCTSTTPGLSQYGVVANHLASDGYHGIFFQTRTINTGTACDAGYGIGTFVWATSTPIASQQYYHLYTHQSGEVRGIICMVAPLFASQDTACGTHLATDIPTAQLQQEEAYNISENTAAVHPGYAHFFGGDFNLCYVNTYRATPHRFYDNYLEANGAPAAPYTGCAAINGQPLYTWDDINGYTGKIDYLFGRASEFTTSTIGRYPYAESDHALMMGVFTTP